MKITIVTVALSHGGAERVGVMLANGFFQQGHQVTILTDCNEPIVYEVDDNVPIVDFVGKAPNKLLKWMKAVVNIRHYLKSVRPDVVIGIMGLCTFVSYVASLGLRIPIIMTEHNAFERPSNRSFSLVDFFAKFYLNKLYKKVTVLTESDKRIIGKRLSNVVVMPNPLALVPMREFQIKSNIILAVGRLDAWYVKGFDVLIQSFTKLLNLANEAERQVNNNSHNVSYKIRKEGWKLQIAGMGNDENLNYLKQLCRENRVEDFVEFLGYRKDVEKLYQDASIFVLSSRYEGFGLVLIEAMSQGCACIACDYKGRQREIISPTPAIPSRKGEECKGIEVCDNGILCEPDNVEALAEAMARMIEDDKYRENVRGYAIERSKYYSIDNVMSRWEEFIMGDLKSNV